MPVPRGKETSRRKSLGRKDGDGPKGKDSIQDLSKKGDERRKRTGIEQRFKFGFINIPTNNTDI